MDISDEKKPDEIDHISKNDEKTMTENIEVLELGKLSLQKNIDNIENYYDESNRINMSDDNISYERDHMSKNDEETMTDVIEVLKLGKLSSQKNIDNVEKEYDKRKRMDIIDDEEYD